MCLSRMCHTDTCIHITIFTLLVGHLWVSLQCNHKDLGCKKGASNLPQNNLATCTKKTLQGHGCSAVCQLQEHGYSAVCQAKGDTKLPYSFYIMTTGLSDSMLHVR